MKGVDEARWIALENQQAQQGSARPTSKSRVFPVSSSNSVASPVFPIL